MKVLVTGGAGFIGMHVCRALQAHGHAVFVIDNLSTGFAGNLPPEVPLYRHDIVAPDLPALVASLAPEAVVHLAAQVSVAASVAAPAADSETNVLGTVRVLEAARAAAVRRFIFASSAAIYGTPNRLPLTERSSAQPLSPYALSKWTAEQYIRLLAAAWGICPSVLRFANVYGPGQTTAGEAGVVAIFCDRAVRGRAPDIYGDGDQTRDFVYVGDVAEAVRLAVEASEQPGTWNVSTGVPLSVTALWEQIRAEAARQSKPLAARNILSLQAVYRPERPGDIRHSYLSSRSIRQSLGWKASTPLEAGLRATVAAVRASETEAI